MLTTTTVSNTHSADRWRKLYNVADEKKRREVMEQSLVDMEETKQQELRRIQREKLRRMHQIKESMDCMVDTELEAKVDLIHQLEELIVAQERESEELRANMREEKLRAKELTVKQRYMYFEGMALSSAVADAKQRNSKLKHQLGQLKKDLTKELSRSFLVHGMDNTDKSSEDVKEDARTRRASGILSRTRSNKNQWASNAA